MIINSNLHCGKCFHHYKEDNRLPACKRGGCPVGNELKKDYPDIETGEAIAADMEITDFINTFIRAKQLYECNGIVDLQSRAYEELGLLADPSWLFELENIWLEAKQHRAKEERNKHGKERGHSSRRTR